MKGLALLLVLAGPALATPYDDQLAAITHGVPHPVRAFIDRRSDCHHWLGEEPYDAARKAEIAKAVTQLRCQSLARDEARLRHRYRRVPHVLAALRKARDLDPG
jgi:hypothetical protein